VLLAAGVIRLFTCCSIGREMDHSPHLEDFHTRH
jgi:hypothetical protein